MKKVPFQWLTHSLKLKFRICLENNCLETRRHYQKLQISPREDEKLGERFTKTDFMTHYFPRNKNVNDWRACILFGGAQTKTLQGICSVAAKSRTRTHDDPAMLPHFIQQPVHLVVRESSFPLLEAGRALVAVEHWRWHPARAFRCVLLQLRSDFARCLGSSGWACQVTPRG